MWYYKGHCYYYTFSIMIIGSLLLFYFDSLVTAIATTTTKQSSRTIQLPIHKRQRQKQQLRQISYSSFTRRSLFGRQQNTLQTADLYNDAGSTYLVSVNIGTPSQSFIVALDTGRYT